MTLVYSAAHPEWIEKSIDAVADSLDVPPFQVILPLFEDEGEGIGQITLNGVIFPELHVRQCLTHPLFPNASKHWPGTRDGGRGEVALHPNCWAWGPHVLGHYVREVGLLTLESAIWKMTGFPAERLGLTDKGVIEAESQADLMIFDLSTVDSRFSYLEPAVEPDGIEHVFVNDQRALSNGALTGSLAGQVL